MAAYSEILKTIPVMQSTALAGTAYGLVKRKKKKFVGTATNLIVGTSLMKETAYLTELST
jgi:hypothetical protein